MWWLILIIVVIAAFAMPRFGKALLIGVAVVVAAVAIFIYESNRSAEVERAASRKRITASEVDLVDLGLQPSYGTGSYKLVGRVRNRSASYNLTELRLKVTMRDCGLSGGCETVGESGETIYANVPPGQTRALDEYVHFSGLGQPRGKHQWDYSILEVLGK